jgi:hypothetical protein
MVKEIHLKVSFPCFFLHRLLFPALFRLPISVCMFMGVHGRLSESEKNDLIMYESNIH